MVGQYKWKTFKVGDKDCMQRAIQAVENKELGWFKAAKQYGVPQATLRRRVSKGKNKMLRGTEKGLGRYKCTVDKNLERELVDHIKLLESRMFGLTAIEWLEHFCQHVKASLEDKVLLVLDGHSSHKNLVVLEYAKTNGVIMVCLPPHCTHRMQPLDVAFFGPFKIFYDQEITRWLKAHSGGVVTQYQISSILSVAFDRPKEPGNAEEFPSSSTSLTNAAKESSSPSHAADTNASSNEKNCDMAVALKVPILEISPLPTSDKVTAKRRATQGPTELTSTPNIKMTKQKAEEKKSRVQRQSKRIVKK
ncbi:hypothetical protein ANN_17666 [Periplaneta americana]|uniref:HTH psq-type domain-containing protein n=1 Tax=Periplaneta americana TaxID=6978 RepID=A0ABQ8SUW9_PERAM|nr:hypothetical protein ANN_17666 [Periplaneta americana]